MMTMKVWVELGQLILIRIQISVAQARLTTMNAIPMAPNAITEETTQTRRIRLQITYSPPFARISLAIRIVPGLRILAKHWIPNLFVTITSITISMVPGIAQIATVKTARFVSLQSVATVSGKPRTVRG